MRTPRLVALALTASLAVSAVACSSSSDDASDSKASTETTAPVAADNASVAATYADLVYQSYTASVNSATELNDKLKALVASPSEETLEAAKDQWLAARDDYGPTEAFRFYDGPIDDPDDGPEGQINAWPMDEAYVDYVEGDPNAGIINDTAAYPTITPDVLVETNEEGGETNISTGWHAIEFLLWGQDNNPDGPGQRPFTDYTTAANAERRGTYLTLLGDLLVADLTSVADQWAPNSGAYRTTFLADPATAVSDMFRGIGALSAGELAGERMGVAYETKDQEDEHSCFSDNTDADVYNNALGIQRVYLAEFPGVSGPSLSDLVAAVNPDLDTQVKDQLANSVALTKAFPKPFEQMIQGPDDGPERTEFLAAMTSIEDQGQLIAQAADALGIKINLEV
jgi:putative iron-regulated protein